MVRSACVFLPVALGALPSLALALGASCNGAGRESVTGSTPVTAGLGRAPTAATATPTTAPSGDERIQDVPGVDVSELTPNERRVWVALVNEELSPCGQPVSVARCAREGRICRRCVPAARHLRRLVAEGYEREQIHEFFELRYAPSKRVEFSIEHAPVRGAPMAPVTITEFSDFECPHCALTQPLLARLVGEFEGRVRWAFLNYPIDGHPNAFAAAQAAMAAGEQGKFWEMADALFAHHTELGSEQVEALARSIGLDLERFRRDAATPAIRARVEADKQLGRGVGIEATPTLFVNGRRFEEPVTALADYIREELDE